MLSLIYRKCTVPTVASKRQVQVEIHRELDSTTKTKLLIQSRSNTAKVERNLKKSAISICWELINQEKQYMERNHKLGVTTLLYQSNHKLEQVNLVTQAIEVGELQIKSIYVFFQRSID
uniref:Uncharacterized protein n=1 Tax=Opuntia streptacantha TaxID=393608 RepID=A0A7C8ZJF5_OPUST